MGSIQAIRITAKEIKNLRERHGITQAELAESMYGIKRERVTDWETGRRGCPPLAAWAMIFHWDGHDIRNPVDLEDWKSSYAL